MMGAVLEWIYRYMAGIQSEDGFRNITINPVLPEGVDFLKCSYESIKGRVEVLFGELSAPRFFTLNAPVFRMVWINIQNS